MNRLLRVICSAAVMLMVSSSVFAQTETTDTKTTEATDTNIKNDSCSTPKEECMPCKPVCKPCCFFEQGMALDDDVKPPCDVKYHPGYNASAAIKVGCPWDFNADISFIYWDVTQDAMDLTYSSPIVGQIGQVIYQDTGYKPGFKIGLGWDTNFDNWNVNAEYTWLHTSHSTSARATPLTATTGGFYQNNWFAVPSALPPGNGGYAGVNSEWKMHMDMLDLVAGRPFYQGTHLTVSPTGGLRCLWIRQSMDVTLTSSGGNTQNSENNSHSWAVGPKAGVNTHWLIWKGLRFDGEMGASVLYTKYTTIENKLISTIFTTQATTTSPSTPASYSAVRPTLDMGLGLGYGMYAYSNKFFFDLAIRYDFSQFWSQNVMRNYTSQLEGSDDVIGNLHMHGLTITLSCDF